MPTFELTAHQHQFDVEVDAETSAKVVIRQRPHELNNIILIYPYIHTY